MVIEFEFTTGFGVFRDALHLDDAIAYTEEELTAMKQARLDNWLAVVNPPPVEG